MSSVTGPRWKYFGGGYLLCFLAFVFACGGCAIALRNAPESCPDRDRIRNGMTKDEVRNALGEPKKITTYQTNDSWEYDCGPFSLSPPISVWFDENGRVEHTYILD